VIQLVDTEPEGDAAFPTPRLINIFYKFTYFLWQ